MTDNYSKQNGIYVPQFTIAQLKAKELVKEKQQDLLWLINTKAGRHILGIKDLKTPITEVFYNGFKFNEGGKQSIYRFYTGAKIFRDLMPFIDYEEELAQQYVAYLSRHLGINEKYKRFLAYQGLEGHLQLQIPQIYNTNYYMGSGDGYLSYYANDTWANVRNSTTANEGGYTATSALIGAYHWSSNYECPRGFFPVDTSGIPDAAEIASASFNGYVTGRNATPTAYVVQTTQASVNELVYADFDNIGSIDGGNASVPAASSWLQIALNSTGIGWISKTGWTKIGLRHDKDFNNITPTNETLDRWYNATSESADDPYLSVTVAPTTSIKKVSGVAYASIKKISGVAIANVKKVAGVS